MEDNNLNKRFFTNTYITGNGRKNYLRIDHLEDPLFTSFTFDIDFVASPLFYTISNGTYGYPNAEGMMKKIEDALIGMYGKYLSGDEGYDILPQLTSNLLDGNKLGFGLQQNIYMDMPLYGATEYIYMVDKRNGTASQNDVLYDSNQLSGDRNGMNSIKLGDSVKSVVNESDKKWAERMRDQNKQYAEECKELIKEGGEAHTQHLENEIEMNNAKSEYENGGKSLGFKDYEGNHYEALTEEELEAKVKEYETLDKEFNLFKEKIAEWVNSNVTKYQNQATNEYMSNPCVKEIFGKDDLANCSNQVADAFGETLKDRFGIDFRDEYIFGDDAILNKLTKIYQSFVNWRYDGVGMNEDKHDEEGSNSFLIETVSGDGNCTVRPSLVIEKFKDALKYFELYDESSNTYKGHIRVTMSKSLPDWVDKINTHLRRFNGNYVGWCENVKKVIEWMMQYQIDMENEDCFKDFISDKVKINKENLDIFQGELEQVRGYLYGYDENRQPCTKNNAAPDSIYGIYKEAKEVYENDEYAQAERAVAMAESGCNEMSKMINAYENNKNATNNDNGVTNTDAQDVDPISRTDSIAATQTVLDMLGFISGMKSMVRDYPYIMQSITGLDTAYNKHYNITDPYLGSGDDKITITCLESLDLRVSSMFNRYFNAVYDRQYRRERVPINLRRFNCSIYVHDVRNFASRMRVVNNRMLELTDMYHSAIEFRFYDCEILPEETGNIFNDISNESPSEMKKTNFTFKYGNCVVNFVPPSEVIEKKSTT